MNDCWTNDRSQWPLARWDCRFESHRGPRYLSVVSVVFCQVEVSATSWSLVQRSPTEYSASLCMIYKPRQRGVPGPLGATAPKERKKLKEYHAFVFQPHVASDIAHPRRIMVQFWYSVVCTVFAFYLNWNSFAKLGVYCGAIRCPHVFLSPTAGQFSTGQKVRVCLGLFHLQKCIVSEIGEACRRNL